MNSLFPLRSVPLAIRFALISLDNGRSNDGRTDGRTDGVKSRLGRTRTLSRPTDRQSDREQARDSEPFTYDVCWLLMGARQEYP